MWVSLPPKAAAQKFTEYTALGDRRASQPVLATEVGAVVNSVWMNRPQVRRCLVSPVKVVVSLCVLNARTGIPPRPRSGSRALHACMWCFVAAAQKALEPKLMNENMTSEGLKRSQAAETGLVWVSGTVGDVVSWPGWP